MRKATITFIMATVLLLSGCPALIVGGGVLGGTMYNDERTTGSFIEDELIENKIILQLADKIGTDAHVGVTSYNRFVLLTGQAPNKALHDRILTIVKNTENVRGVYDKMEIAGPSSFTTRASDTVLTARIKTELCRLQIKGFSCLDVKIVTEKGVVYLMGLLTLEQAATAVKTTRSIKGVLKVVKVFQKK